MAIEFKSPKVAKNTITERLEKQGREAKLQEKSVEYTQNKEYEVLPDEGFDGMSKVNVSVDVVVPTVQNSKTVNINANGTKTILPDADYDVVEQVIVNTDVQPKLQEKTVDVLLSETSTNVLPDSGYDGMSSITVNHSPVESNTAYTATSNGSYVIHPSEGFDATTSVNLTVNVPTSGKEEIVGEIIIDDPTKWQTYHYTAPTGKVWKELNIQTPVEFKIDLSTGIKCLESTWTTLPKIIGTPIKANALVNMFKNNRYLRTADLSEMDLGRATSFEQMFIYCDSLTDLTLPNADTSAITSMLAMFGGCSSLTQIVFPSTWNTSNVETMASMFSGCSGLTSLNLSTFDTEKLTNMYDMFAGCSGIKTMVFENNFFKTSSNTLKEYDLSGLTNWTNFVSQMLIAKLPEGAVDKSVKLSANTYASLDETDLSNATAKGWTIKSA